MSIIVNIRYTGENGSARAFADEIDLFGNFKVNAENYRWHKSM